MPKKPKLAYEQLAIELRGVLRKGPASATEICRLLGINQPSFSRLCPRLGDDLLVAGRAGRTRYALKRSLASLGTSVVVFAIDVRGKARESGLLHAVHPAGFCLQQGRETLFFEDLPYFIQDLRPSGFLGRLIPKQHPEFHFPEDVRLWSSNDILLYLAHFGWDLIGNLVVGEKAFQMFLEKVKSPPAGIPLRKRGEVFTQMADHILNLADAGSSAGGEQPKFLALRGPGRIPVLVKFSPRMTHELARRRADLLVCEHVAHRIVGKYGVSGASSTLIQADQRLFLEVDRFDRKSPWGRKGVISLQALDDEFVGSGKNWSTTASELLKQKRIPKALAEKIFWLEMFGHLIGNTDMHLNNLSFFTEGFDILGLTNVYDMAPMLYAPQNEQIIERKFEPILPSPARAGLWREARAAAQDFWRQVIAHPLLSTDFKKISRAHQYQVEKLGSVGEILPDR